MVIHVSDTRLVIIFILNKNKKKTIIFDNTGPLGRVDNDDDRLWIDASPTVSRRALRVNAAARNILLQTIRVGNS